MQDRFKQTEDLPSAPEYIDGLQISNILVLEGKCVIMRQLDGGAFTLRKQLLLSFNDNSKGSP